MKKRPLALLGIILICCGTLGCRDGQFEVKPSVQERIDKEKVEISLTEEFTPPLVSKIAYQTGSPGFSQIWLISPDGTTRMLLQENGYGSVFSPDGKKIVYGVYYWPPCVKLPCAKSNELKVINLETFFEETLLTMEGVAPCDFRWSPDSQRIYFRRALFYTDAGFGSPEYIDLATRESQVLTNHNAWYSYFDVSRISGSLILVQREFLNESQRPLPGINMVQDSLWIADKNGGNPRKIFTTPPTEIQCGLGCGHLLTAPVWSPNEEFIAFVLAKWEKDKWIPTESTINIMKPDGSIVQTATVKIGVSGGAWPASVTNLTWSPDSKKIAFIHNAETISLIDRTLFLVDSNGDLRVFAKDVSSFTWSPDSMKIAYNRIVRTKEGSERNEIWIAPIDDATKARKLTDGILSSWALVPASPKYDEEVFKRLLAQKFAPILWLHPEEVYEPKEVRIIIENADLRMKEWRTRIPFDRPLTPLDLATVPDSENLFLDIKDVNLLEFEGIEYQGAWVYAQKYREIENRYLATVYARVVVQEGKTIVQYWFFYFFNDGPINNHEGDWEMAQLVLDGIDYEQILTSGTPESVTYSQHGDKETREWENVLRKTENHPYIFVAKGSHANYFDPGNWALGTEPGSFDEASGEGKVAVPLVSKIETVFQKTLGIRATRYQLVLLPELDEKLLLIKDAPWLVFKGLWGEWWPHPARLLVSGPSAPATKEVWHNPLK